jgi:hypothetical protein
MTHGERTMTMPTWPMRFDGVPTAVKSAPLLGEHTAEVLADWLGLDAAAVAGLRQDGIVKALAAGPPDLCRRLRDPGPRPADAAARTQFSRSSSVEQPWPRPTPIYPSSDQSASSNAHLGPFNLTLRRQRGVVVGNRRKKASSEAQRSRATIPLFTVWRPRPRPPRRSSPSFAALAEPGKGFLTAGIPPSRNDP